MDTNIPNLIALTLCLLASFLLSGMEAGVFALNRLRIRRLARGGKPSAQMLNRFLEKPEKFLWTILVGNTLANFIILGWILAKLHEWFLGQTALIVTLFALIVFLFYTFFDLLPKMLFRAHPNSLCLSAARPFRIVNVLLSPLVLIVEDVSQTILKWTGGQVFTGRLFGNREEMRAIMRESGQALTDDEHAMVNRILDLQNFTVSQVAKPLAETPTVESQTPLRVALALARQAYDFAPAGLGSARRRTPRRRPAGHPPAGVSRQSGRGKTGADLHDAGGVRERRHPAGSGAAADAARRPAHGDCAVARAPRNRRGEAEGHFEGDVRRNAIVKADPAHSRPHRHPQNRNLYVG